jgi:hypothetical protein
MVKGCMAVPRGRLLDDANIFRLRGFSSGLVLDLLVGSYVCKMRTIVPLEKILVCV